jgi:hypothetical protein
VTDTAANNKPNAYHDSFLNKRVTTPIVSPRLHDQSLQDRCHSPEAGAHSHSCGQQATNSPQVCVFTEMDFQDLDPSNTPSQQVQRRRRIEASIDYWLSEAAEFVPGR